jgi:hypothetical protein
MTEDRVPVEWQTDWLPIRPFLLETTRRTTNRGSQSANRIPNLDRFGAEKLARLTPGPATQWRSNSVSGVSLPKTGIFAVAAGDFRHIGIGFGEFWSLETVYQIAKTRQLWAFLPIPGVVSPASAVVGWRRSADRTFLQLNSLLSGNLTGNFVYFEHPRDLSGAKPAVRRALFKQFPGLVNRENYSRIREISRRNRERDQQLRPRSTVQRRTSCSSTPLRAAVIKNQKAPGAFN